MKCSKAESRIFRSVWLGPTTPGAATVGKKDSHCKKTLCYWNKLIPGEQDYIDHFHAVLPALQDKRYICVDGKPLFAVFRPHDCPDMARFIAIWRDLAVKKQIARYLFRRHGKTMPVIKPSMIPSVNNAAECYKQRARAGIRRVCSRFVCEPTYWQNKMFSPMKS